MLYKTLLIVGLVSLTSAADIDNPNNSDKNNKANAGEVIRANHDFNRKSKHINKDLVHDIKNKTKEWIPHDPETNPLKNMTDEEL